MIVHLKNQNTDENHAKIVENRIFRNNILQKKQENRQLSIEREKIEITTVIYSEKQHKVKEPPWNKSLIRIVLFNQFDG